MSGCPPTGTRPQARAKLGNSVNRVIDFTIQAFFSQHRQNLHPRVRERWRATRWNRRTRSSMCCHDAGMNLRTPETASMSSLDRRHFIAALTGLGTAILAAPRDAFAQQPPPAAAPPSQPAPRFGYQDVIKRPAILQAYPMTAIHPPYRMRSLNSISMPIAIFASAPTRPCYLRKALTGCICFIRAFFSHGP